MTKKELLDMLREELPQAEGAGADRVLEEVRRAPDPGDAPADPDAVEGLRRAVTRHAGGSVGDAALKAEFIRAAYLAFIAEKPLHPDGGRDIRRVSEGGVTVYECAEKSSEKDSVCAWCPCRRMSNYEITKRRTQRQIPAYDIAAAAKKLGLETDGRRLCFKFIGRDFLVDWADGSVRKKRSEDEAWEEAGFNEAMTIYDLLCWSEEGASVSGEYTPMQNLSRVSNARSYAGEGMFKKDEELFDGRDEELAQACRALGGTPWGKGDVSYRIPVFGPLSAVLSFWDSDEEFPASLRLMCDTNTLRFMHYETVWYMASCLLERVRELLDRGDARG